MFLRHNHPYVSCHFFTDYTVPKKREKESEKWRIFRCINAQFLTISILKFCNGSQQKMIQAEDEHIDTICSSSALLSLTLVREIAHFSDCSVVPPLMAKVVLTHLLLVVGSS